MLPDERPGFQSRVAGRRGVDWPITQRELHPYYLKAEELLRIRGHADGLNTIPDVGSSKRGLWIPMSGSPAKAWKD